MSFSNHVAASANPSRQCTDPRADGNRCRSFSSRDGLCGVHLRKRDAEDAKPVAFGFSAKPLEVSTRHFPPLNKNEILIGITSGAKGTVRDMQIVDSEELVSHMTAVANATNSNSILTCIDVLAGNGPKGEKVTVSCPRRPTVGHWCSACRANRQAAELLNLIGSAISQARAIRAENA